VKQEALRSQVYQLLKKQRDHFQQSLSDNAKPLTIEKGRLHSFLPIWIFATLLVLAGFLIYQNWLIDLNRQSDQVVTELAGLIPKPQEDALPSAQVRREVLFLQQLLASEIERDILSVDDFANRSSITLHAGELFPSGSADIRSAYYPILDKIAKALESIPGDIKVYGHTDNVAIRTANFPSNWHLSLARASAVSKYLSQVALLTGRVLPEGRGDTEPVASNDTPEGRALNRRVTIELLYD
jgi:type VI secretion system protein ImpK